MAPSPQKKLRGATTRAILEELGKSISSKLLILHYQNIFFFPLLITFYLVLIITIAAYYQNLLGKRVDHLHISKRNMGFGNVIGNMLKHSISFKLRFLLYIGDGDE